MAKNQLQDVYGLSPMQSGLLFQAIYAPESDAYFVQSVFELKGEVDISALKKAWQKVSDHHPILKTGFVWQNLEAPLQYVLESAEVPFEIMNWQTLTEMEQDQKLEEFIKEDRQKGFNLNKAPLFRLTLIQCNSNRYYFIWSQHHILIDGWCSSIVLGDVFKAYESLRQGGELHLISRRPYREYIAWLQTQDLNKAEAFWKNYLSSLEEPTKLNFSNILEENQEKNYDTYSVAFSVEDTDEIKAFAQQHSLTLNTVIQGAVGLVIKTYTQQKEAVMGVTVSGRSIDLPGAEEMVGLFINTLPLKITSDPAENTLSFLKSLQEQAQKLNDYAYTHLAQIQSWSGINQSLFDVLFVFENYPLDEEIHKIASDLIIRDVQGVEKTEYPLTVVVRPGKQIHLTLSYQTKHFNEEIIKRFSDHTKQVLRGILHHSNESSQTLSLLTRTEEHQLLIEWNDTKADYSADKTIHQLFEEQVEKTPNSPAVIHEDQELSYQQLNEKANQLAHHLRSLGIKPDTPVAIAVERSLEMIIALLGILKAGGAYVPLDPSYPEERLQFMLEDTKAPILITQAHLNQIFNAYSGTTLNLHLEGEKMKLFIEEKYFNAENSGTKRRISCAVEASQNLESLTAPHNLAYVIYTSGSTGKPKGVMIEHRNTVAFLYWAQETFSLDILKSVLGSTSICFDLSIYEIFLPLIVGGEVVIVKDALALLRSSHKSRISLINTVPSAITVLLREQGILENVKIINLAGEPLKRSLVQSLYDFYHIKEVYNLYGPSEDTTYSTYALIERDSLNEPPIGMPISNTQTYILDASLNPVPVGISGELYIGGVGLARGYLNRPDLTAERFIPNPFFNQENGQDIKSLKLYRTGDMARYLPNGNIEFLGRVDHQVKIRGFRIELGEIESVLQSYENVAQAVVLAREDESDKSVDNKKLVAYVVLPEEDISSLAAESTLISSSGEPFSVLSGGDLSSVTEELRNHLAQSLPDYMVPSFFVYIDKIPLTPNGKIDRKSLPAPDLSLRFVGDDYVAPRNELEQRIVEIWIEVLGLPEDTIGIQDDFFRMGGDSILSIQVVSRLRKRLRLSINVKDIFKHRSIKVICDHLFKEKQEESRKIGFKTEQGMLKGDVPLLPIQEWFFENRFNNINYWNQSFIIKTPSLDLDRLQKSLTHLFKYHDGFRLRFRNSCSRKKNSNIEYVQYYDEKAREEELKVLDIRSLKGQEGTKEFEEELNEILTNCQSKFDIEEGPVYSIGYLYGYKDGSARIYFALHHLIVDTVSWRILTENLKDLYDGKSLGSKKSSYRQFVESVKTYEREHEEEKEYWTQLLSDYSENKFTELLVSEETQNSQHIILTQEQTKNLLGEANQAYQTEVNDLLLVALGHTLSKITKSQVNHILLEGHGREEIDTHIDITGTLGWFTTMYPVRLETLEDPGESIKNIKETLRQIPNKGIGHGTIIGYKDVRLPRISFNYLGQFNREKNSELRVQAQDNKRNWVIIMENSGISTHPSNYDHNIININGLVINGVFQFHFSTKFDKKTTLEIAKFFKESLEKIISYCVCKYHPEYTMGDFDNFEPYVSFNKESKSIDSKLFLFPPGGGGAESYFQNIAPKLQNIELVIFNNYYDYIKESNNDDFFKSLTYEALASNYISYIKTIQVKGPYNLFGWSFGGVLAFEVARQLIKRGDDVQNIFMIDSYFNYKNALKKLKIKNKDRINYQYLPLLDFEMSCSNIILFKSNKSIDGDRISKYYAENTECNDLDSILQNNSNFQILRMNDTHDNWVNNQFQITEICKTIKKCLGAALIPSAPEQNSTIIQVSS